MSRCISCLILILLLYFHSLGVASGSNNEWQLYDINKDGRFDRSDIDVLRERIWQGFDQDINRDGRKDINDAFYLYVKLSVLDRNCNGIADDKDFKPMVRVVFPPSPDVNTISQLIVAIISKSSACLPSDMETLVLRSAAKGKTLSADDKAYVYQLVGITSLAKRNLEAAKWGFAKAHQLKDGSSLPSGNLAFCLAMEGRYPEALMLLANARRIFPGSAASATTTGWIFARHGQNEEARKYYEEAVLLSPGIGQYHFNLGIILLRLGKNREAWEEFKKASELNPGDSRKFLFSYLTRPADMPPENRPLTMGELKEATTRQIDEAKKAGWAADELPTPWDQQSCCEQGITIAEILEKKYQKQIDEMAEVISNDLAKKMEEVIKPFMPEWKDFCKDWKKYHEGVPYVYDETLELSINASNAAGNERAALTRKMGAELLSYSSIFMNCALKEAAAGLKTELKKWEGMEDMIPAKNLAELKSDAYKETLKNALDQCYKTPINKAYGYLTAQGIPYFQLPDPDIKTITPDEFFGLYMAMPLACLEIKGYCNNKTTCYTGTEKEPVVTSDEVYSIDLWIVSIEYNSESGEWEFNFDLGITLGATWNPATGFGFQIGMDFSLGFLAGVEAGFYFKYDEGVWTYEETEGLFAGIGPFSYAKQTSSSVPVTNFQAVPEEPGNF